MACCGSLLSHLKTGSSIWVHLCYGVDIGVNVMVSNVDRCVSDKELGCFSVITSYGHHERCCSSPLWTCAAASNLTIRQQRIILNFSRLKICRLWSRIYEEREKPCYYNFCIISYHYVVFVSCL